MIKFFNKNSYKWSILGVIIAIILAGCALTNANVNKTFHKTISVDEVATVKTWGNSIPNGEEKEETKEGIEKIVKWFNSITDIRENKELSGSTPESGIIIELKSRNRISVLRSGDQFEIQKDGISYWGKQPELNILLENLAGKPPESQPNQSIDSGVTEVNQENKSNGEIKAEKDAQDLIKFIKEKDAVKLLQLLNTSQLDIEGANKIIEGFDVNFDLDTLSVQFNHDGSSMYPELGQYEFLIMDKDHKDLMKDRDNELVIRYNEDGSRVFTNPYVYYFPYAEKMIVRYLDLIREGNATELAKFLNPDDIDVPDWVAQKTINNYNDFFDSGNMTIHYTNRFVFVIEDGEGKEHVIEVRHGDGLMSIKDDFIPDFSN